MNEVPFKKKEVAIRETYIPYAGPYGATRERWMADKAIEDIMANHRDLPCFVQCGQMLDIWIIPNFYGRSLFPYQKLSVIDSADHTLNTNETLDDVLKSQAIATSLPKAEARIRVLPPPTP